MAYLDRNYKDTGAPIRAANELRTLRQRDVQSLAGFLPKFEQKLAEAGGADWADQAKIIFLGGALNSQMRCSLVSVDLPTDYQGWLTRVQDIASRLERLQPPGRYPSSQGYRHWNPTLKGKGQRQGLKTQPHKEQPPPKDAEGDTTMIGATQGKKQRRRRGSTTSAAPTPEDMACHRCWGKGHLARHCRMPYEKIRKQDRIQRVDHAKSSDSEKDSQDPSTEEDDDGRSFYESSKE